jgi:2-polyprenyl-6-methoxyphenol hydroxylase-like FAD-dependent oxidoreductase
MPSISPTICCTVNGTATNWTSIERTEYDMHQLSPHTEPFDVVVVGARLAGAATAMLLARQGLRVALLDRSCMMTDTLSTHAFLRGGVLQLHRWGLLDGVKAAGTPAVRRTTFTYADAVVPIAIEPQHGVDALYAPRRTVIDPILVRAAAEAGAEFRYGLRVTGITRTASGRPTGVKGVDSDNLPFTIPARFVVGADGIHSTIARAVAAPVEQRGRHSAVITYGYWTGADIDGYEWIFVRDASAGIIPTNDNQVVVFANATQERIGRGGVGVIQSIVRSSAPALAERLDDAQPPAGTRLFRAPVGFIRRSWGRGWALVGDAGHFKDPISAHGMTDALRDAELLARALISIHHGEDEAVALSEYQATRDALAVPYLRLVDAVAAHQWSSRDIEDLLKQQAALMRREAALLVGLDAPAQAARAA